MAKGCVVYMRVGRIRLVAGRWIKAEEEQKKTPPQKEAHM